MDAYFTAEERQRSNVLRKRWLGYEMKMRFGDVSTETVKSAYCDYIAVHEAAIERAFQAREGAKLLRQIGVGS